MTANVVGVVCALEAEARHLAPAGWRDERLVVLADGTLVAVSGMGIEAAAQSARALLRAGAEALVSWGMAGGLDPALAPGTIFLPTEILSTTGAALPSAGAWRERVAAALASRVELTQKTVATGKLLTSATAIASRTDKARLFLETGAAAVDMESLAVAEAARAAQKPFLAVRVIVDGAADSLPRAVTAAANDQGHLQLWRLIGALARQPGEIGSLIQLARRYRAASRSLAAVARLGSLAPYAFSRTVDAP